MNKRRKLTCRSYKALRRAMSGVAGDWRAGENYCQFRATTGGILNYWKSTGTVDFQGPELKAAKLKAMFLKRVQQR